MWPSLGLIGLHLLVLDHTADVLLHVLKFFFVLDVKQSLLQPSRVLFDIEQFFVLGLARLLVDDEVVVGVQATLATAGRWEAMVRIARPRFAD